MFHMQYGLLTMSTCIFHLPGFIDDTPHRAKSPLNQGVSAPTVLILGNVISLNGLVRHRRKYESAEKQKVLWGKVIVHSACCSAMILTCLRILRGVKVKNCHQIRDWFQLVLPATKQPLSVCHHWLVLILRLVPLHLIATGPLSVLQPDYQSSSIVLCIQPSTDTTCSQNPQNGTFTLWKAKIRLGYAHSYGSQKGQKAMLLHRRKIGWVVVLL